MQQRSPTTWTQIFMVSWLCVLNHRATRTLLLMVFLVERNNVCLWWLCGVAPIINNKPRGWHLYMTHTGRAGEQKMEQNTLLGWAHKDFFTFSSKNICTWLPKQIYTSFSILCTWHDVYHVAYYMFGNQSSQKTTQTKWNRLVSQNVMKCKSCLTYTSKYTPAAVGFTSLCHLMVEQTC